MSPTQPSISDLYSEDKNGSDLFWEQFGQDRYPILAKYLDDLTLSPKVVYQAVADLIIAMKEYLCNNFSLHLEPTLTKPNDAFRKLENYMRIYWKSSWEK